MLSTLAILHEKRDQLQSAVARIRILEETTRASFSPAKRKSVVADLKDVVGCINSIGYINFAESNLMLLRHVFLRVIFRFPDYTRSRARLEFLLAKTLINARSSITIHFRRRWVELTAGLPVHSRGEHPLTDALVTTAGVDAVVLSLEGVETEAAATLLQELYEKGARAGTLLFLLEDASPDFVRSPEIMHLCSRLLEDEVDPEFLSDSIGVHYLDDFRASSANPAFIAFCENLQEHIASLQRQGPDGYGN